MDKINKNNIFNNIGQIYLCEQCGRCSSACPLTGINDFNIRKIIKYIELNKKNKIIKNNMPWFCLTCGKCEDACPNGIKILSLIRSIRKILNKKLIPKISCIENCPLNINIPKFIRMISENKLNKALKIILEKTPMPKILGRVCNKPCELKCKRGLVDSPVSVCNLKRYVADQNNISINNFYKPGEKTNKKILIIGSGPSGLSASYYLRKKGHSIHIIEKKKKLGGMMRYGIPKYRLPELILDDEINKIINMGIKIETNIKNNFFAINKKIKKNYDAILIAIGLQKSSDISINKKIKKNDNIILGLNYLKKISSQNKSINKKILVVGGGNVAIDTAMSALRLGAKKVNIVSLESKQNMPANHNELEIAINEKINILNSWGIKKISENKLIKNFEIELINCISVFNKNKNFKPKFGNVFKKIHADQIIIAIGQKYDKESIKNIEIFLEEKLNLKNSLINVNLNNKIIKNKNIFATGDITYGNKSVAEAISSGRKVAKSIDIFLGGDGIFFKKNNDNCYDNINKIKKFPYLERQKQKILNKKKRINSFNEINLGLNKKKSNYESFRCLKCDLESKIIS